MNRVTNQEIEQYLTALQAGLNRLKSRMAPLAYTLLIDGDRLSQSLPYFEAIKWRDTLAGSHPGAVIIVVIVQGVSDGNKPTAVHR